MKKILLITFLLGTLFDVNAQNIPSYVPSNGLVAWWPFTGNAIDSSGNGNNGTVNGATLTTDRFGKSNRAYDFNGTSNFITIPAKIKFTQNPISYSFWFNKDGVGKWCSSSYFESWQNVFSTGSYTQSRDIFLDMGNNLGLQRSIPSGCANSFGYPTNLSLNSWNHGVVIYESNSLKVYLNGKLIGTTSISCSVSTINNTSYIGASNPAVWACVGYFNGKLDDIAIWNRILDPCEIMSLYQSQIYFPSLTIGNDTQKYCGIDSVKLTTTAGFKSYLWNNRDTGKSIFINQSKKVTVIGTDAIGCKAYDTAIVSILNPKIIPSDTIACWNTQVVLRSKKTIPSQQFPTKLTWSTSDTTAKTNITAVSDTLIWLKATDGIGTCFDTSEIHISKPEILLPDTTLFTSCSRDSMIVNIGAKWKSILWSNGSRDSGTYLKTTGMYYVEALDVYGCRDFDSMYFVNPGKPQIVSFKTDSVKCFGLKDGSIQSQVSGGFLPYAYRWNDAAQQTTDKAVNLNAGVYKLHVKDAYNCSDSATAVVNEPAALKVSIVSTDSVNCFGGSDGSILSSVSGGTPSYSSSWNDLNRQNSLKATNLKKGLYRVVVKDFHGCSDSITATVQEPEKVVVSIPTIKQVSCYGYANGSAIALASGGTGTLSYNWNTSPKQVGTSATGLSPGSYKAYVSDANGCIDSTSVVITQPEKIVPVISSNRLAIRDVLHPLSCSVTPTQTYTYNWTPLSVFGIPSNYSSINGKFQTTTLVTLRTADINGCYGEDTATITVLIPFIDFIPTAFTPNGDKINDLFGLPDYFIVEQLDVYNRWGEMLFKGNENNPTWDGKYNGQTVPEGTYMFLVKARLKDTKYIFEHQGVISVMR